MVPTHSSVARGDGEGLPGGLVTAGEGVVPTWGGSGLECAAMNAPAPAEPPSSSTQSATLTASLMCRRYRVDRRSALAPGHVVADDELAQLAVVHEEHAPGREPRQPLHEPHQPGRVLQHEHVEGHTGLRELQRLGERELDR